MTLPPVHRPFGSALRALTRPVLRAVAGGSRQWLVALSAVLLVISASTAVPTATAAPKGGPAGTAGSTAVARSRVAADVLMQSYDPVKAWFPSSWWNSAVALQTIGDYMQRTGHRRFVPQLDNTFEKDKGTFPAGELSGDPLLGNFTSRAIDDSEWWGLTWVQAYDLTGKKKYLDMAEKIATYVHGYWDTSTCGGGVWWNAERTYKNAVTNGLYIRLTAELHNRLPGDTLWLGRATTAYSWFTHSGLINSAGLVNDGLTDTCTNNGQTVWSYNQGLAIGAALELYRATGDHAMLAEAKRLADAAMHAPALVTHGVLTESCDAPDQTCDDNGKQFKGVFMRYFMDLADTTRAPRYTAFVAKQAASIWSHDRDAAGRLGERWNGVTGGDHPNVFDWRTQASALSALIADVPRHAPTRSLAATTSPAQPVVMPAGSGSARVTEKVGISVTGPAGRSQRVRIRLSAPKGWQVTPDTAALTVPTRGVAHPVSRTVTVRVTVPSSATTGTHSVRATVTGGGLTFHARADVLIARSIDFDTGTAAENPWLFDADGSQSNGVQNRFADGTSHFTYRFPLPKDTATAKVALTIDAEFLVQASPDGSTWTTVLKEDQPVTDGSNKATRTVDLTKYLSPSKVVYLKVSDSFPADGWGGRLYHLTADLSED